MQPRTQNSSLSSHKGFSLLELVIVLIIVGILIIAASRLFQMPRQYILESERCIALIDGYVREFFYQAVSGKSLSLSGAVTPAENYSLVFQPGGAAFQIFGGYTDSSGGFISTTVLSPGSLSSYALPGCMGDGHYVHIAGAVGALSSTNLRIDIHKNLQQNSLTLPMTICPSDSDQNCNGPYATTGIINYSICQTGTTGCIQDRIFATQLFDTRTQSIKSKKCLSLPANGNCKRRSTNEF